MNSLLFLLILSMAWRTAIKAHTLWQQESASKVLPSVDVEIVLSAPSEGPEASKQEAGESVEAGSGCQTQPLPQHPSKGYSSSSSSGGMMLLNPSHSGLPGLYTLHEDAAVDDSSIKLRWVDDGHGTLIVVCDSEGLTKCTPEPMIMVTHDTAKGITAPGDVDSTAGSAWYAPERTGCAFVFGHTWPNAVAADSQQNTINIQSDCIGISDRVRAALLAEQRAQLPPLQVGLMILMLLTVVICHASGSVASCGTSPWWVATMIPIPLMFVFTAIARQHVLWKAAWRSVLGLSEDDQTELHWDARKTIVYPAITVMAGITAGMLGAGGSAVLTPLMLELNVHPQVTAASTQVRMHTLFSWLCIICTATCMQLYSFDGRHH